MASTVPLQQKAACLLTKQVDYGGSPHRARGCPAQDVYRPDRDGALRVYEPSHGCAKSAVQSHRIIAPALDEMDLINQAKILVCAIIHRQCSEAVVLESSATVVRGVSGATVTRLRDMISPALNSPV
ncbi:hypothetical protein EEB11_18435 [Pseudotabrizicola sediminis]|uniref:Uncharacterized protein n=1 Tax=Pseudotabrizicola sediminis TaxID=2486418 RepID=A0ABY2KK26_9RHOB|nr:hypothetical protein EEB11_18435 [Pseudotabrizicola sediminis]